MVWLIRARDFDMNVSRKKRSYWCKMLGFGCSDQEAEIWLFRARDWNLGVQRKRLGCGIKSNRLSCLLKRLGCGCSDQEAETWLFR